MILVTGGTGLVGSHLLYQLLIENNSVKAIHQETSDLNIVKKVFSYYTPDFDELFNRIIWVQASLNDISELEIAFESVTYVYHCAALVSFNPRDYKKMRKVNIEGTTNIVNFCISNFIQKLCFVSSVAAIGKNKELLINESAEWNNSTPKSGYAITKYGAEMEIWRACQEGIDIVIVCPGIILGSGLWNKGSGKMFRQIYNGFKFYTEGVTGFVGVKDVVIVMQKLMKSKITNERFILVSQNISFKNIFFQMADAFGKKRPKFKVSTLLSELIWRMDYIKSKLLGIPPLLTKNSAKSSQSKNYYSSEKIEKELPYKFEKIEKTIKSICNDYVS